MDHLRILNRLAQNRSYFHQVIWAVFFCGLTILIETLLWKWLAPTPFVMLPLCVLLASLFGGGMTAGFVSTIILTAFSLTFPDKHGWLPVLVFFISGLVFTTLIRMFQEKVRVLASTEIRAIEAERLKFAAASAKLGIWEWDMVSDSLAWDDQMLEFYGIKRSAFNGCLESWESRVYPPDLQPLKEALKSALQGKKNYDVEFRVVLPNGDLKTLRAHGLIIRDQNGSPIKMFGLNRDITEEKTNLKKIEELKAFFEVALFQSPAGIVIADAPTGALRFVNPAALKIAGGSEELLVRGVDIPQYDRWQIETLDGRPIPNEELPLAQAVRFGKSSSENVVFVRPNGEKKVVFSQTAPVRRDDGSILSGITVFVDTTEQHRLMEELKKAREIAEAAVRSKARFLDIAAHELRTPVTAVSLLAQLSERKLEKGEAVDSSVLRRIRIQLDRLSRLVVDLLEVSKLDRGMLELRYEMTDLRALIQECRSMFNIQFPNRKINFSAPTEPILLSIDPIRIYEVVSNLLDNAIKYSPENSSIDLELSPGLDFVRCLVKDYGPGLTEDTKGKLFGAFERGDNSERASGLGLGLFICRGILSLHGGSIGVTSSPGAGSTFYFDLPLRNEVTKSAS